MERSEVIDFLQSFRGFRDDKGMYSLYDRKKSAVVCFYNDAWHLRIDDCRGVFPSSMSMIVSTVDDLKDILLHWHFACIKPVQLSIFDKGDEYERSKR